MKKTTILLSLVCLLNMACKSEVSSDDQFKPVDLGTGNEHQQFDGASDSGGGDVKKSSTEEVTAAIYNARDLLMDETFREALFTNLVARTKTEKVRLAAFSLVVPMYHASFDLDEWSDQMDSINVQIQNEEIDAKQYMESFSKLFDAESKASLQPIEEQLADIEINILADSQCVGNNNHVDASVSSHDQEAAVCFSAYSLQRINSSDLVKHMVGLWVHEIVHTHGFGEIEAVEIHDLIVENYDSYVNSKSFRKFFERINYSQMYVGNVLGAYMSAIDSYHFYLEMEKENLSHDGSSADELFHATVARAKLSSEIIFVKEFFKDYNKLFITDDVLKTCSAPVYDDFFSMLDEVQMILEYPDVITNSNVYKAYKDDLKRLQMDLAMDFRIFKLTTQSAGQKSPEEICAELKKM